MEVNAMQRLPFASRQDLLTIMSTEHFTLQGARSAAISDASGRTSFFLSTLSAGSLGSSEQISDFTALGDPVNATARLASLAGPGELLISAMAAEHGGLETGTLERRTVDVRGREAGLDVFSEYATIAGSQSRGRGSEG